jgi:hypothetical protein
MAVPTVVMNIGLRCGVDWTMPLPWMARAIQLEIDEAQKSTEDLWAAWGVFVQHRPKRHERAWERYCVMHNALGDRRDRLLHDQGNLRHMIEARRQFHKKP